MWLCLLALQGLVIPSVASGLEGGDLVTKPFGYDRSRVAQYVGASHLPSKMLVREIAFRRDGLFAARTTMRRVHWWNSYPHGMTVHIGTAAKPWPRRFEDRSRYVQVLRRAKISYPDLPWVDRATQPFSMRLRLDRPYVHTGGDVVVDIETTNALAQRYDYFVDAARHPPGRGVFTRLARGCQPGEASVAFGDPLELNAVQMPPNQPVLCIVGAAGWDTECLRVRPDVVGVTRANASGIARLSLPWVAGAEFYCQWWPSSTTLRVRTAAHVLDAMQVVRSGDGTRRDEFWIDRNVCAVMEWR